MPTFTITKSHLKAGQLGVATADWSQFNNASREVAIYCGPNAKATCFSGRKNNYQRICGSQGLYGRGFQAFDLAQLPLQVGDIVEYRVVVTQGGTDVFLQSIRRQGKPAQFPQASLVGKAVELLEESGILSSSHRSPWPTLGGNEDKEWLDWDRLFPRARSGERGDTLRLEPTDDQAEKLLQHLNEGQRGRTERSEMCWDTCAWYQPIHFFGQDFGIFIKKECVVRTALEIARFIGGQMSPPFQVGPLWRELVRASICAYFLHEQYHHKVECLGFRLHVVLNKSAYMPYHSNVYAQCLNTDDQLEEALANADSWQRLSNQPYSLWISAQVRKALKDYLKWEFQWAPPGYRKAVDYLQKKKFDRGENLLQARVREAALNPVFSAADWDLAPGMTKSFFPVTSNIWLVSPKGAQNALKIAFV
jgi:hypothetical protein